METRPNERYVTKKDLYALLIVIFTYIFLVASIIPHDGSASHKYLILLLFIVGTQSYCVYLLYRERKRDGAGRSTGGTVEDPARGSP